jgi:hypothetical protein
VDTPKISDFPDELERLAEWRRRRRVAEELRGANADAERRMEEMRAMEEGRLRRGPFRERRTG